MMNNSLRLCYIALDYVVRGVGPPPRSCLLFSLHAGIARRALPYYAVMRTVSLAGREPNAARDRMLVGAEMPPGGIRRMPRPATAETLENG